MAGIQAPFGPLTRRLATQGLVNHPRHLRRPGDPSRSGHFVHVVGFFEPVLDQQMQIVTLVKDFAADVRVELLQPAHLAVLLGDQFLIHGGYLDEQVIAHEVKVWSEEPGGLPFLIPGDRKGSRLVRPFDPVEIEKPGELSFAVVGKLSNVCRAGPKYVLTGQLAPTSPAAATAVGVPVSSSSGNNW